MQDFLRNHNFKGKGRLLKLLNLTAKTVVVPYLDHSLIEINTNEHLGHEIFWNQGYEIDVLWVLDYISDSEGICLDLGANIGVWSLPMSRRFREVHCVEPHPVFRKKLENNISINQISNAFIYETSIGSQQGSAVLHAPPPEMRNKSASMLELNSELTERINVDVVSLDALFSGLKRIDFIKIDCDGSDGDIILSGASLLEIHLPIIIFEDMGGYHPSMGSHDLIQKVDGDYDKAYELLVDLGYKIFEVGNKYLTETVRPKGRFSNILAIPNKNPKKN